MAEGQSSYLRRKKLMNTTMPELLRELSYIAGDENYLKKALEIIKELVAQKKEEERILIAGLLCL